MEVNFWREAPKVSATWFRAPARSLALVDWLALSIWTATFGNPSSKSLLRSSQEFAQTPAADTNSALVATMTFILINRGFVGGKAIRRLLLGQNETAERF